jgi:outer membrane biogenesis lipoprotein LolB
MSHTPFRSCWVARLMLACALVVGCGPKRVSRTEATRVVEELRSRPIPRSLQARFQIKVGSASGSGSTTGAMVTHMPDKFRLEILTPLGTPMITVASNGEAIHAWSQQRATFYRGDDALKVLGELTGGAVDMTDVLRLLTGGLPLHDAPVLATEAREDGVLVVLGAPGDVRIRALIAPKKRLVRRVDIGLAPSSDSIEISELYAVFDIHDHMRIDGAHYPEEMLVELPPVGWTLELTFHTWDELGVIPDVFDIEPPAGGHVEDLEATLRKAADQQQLGQPSG